MKYIFKTIDNRLIETDDIDKCLDELLKHFNICYDEEKFTCIYTMGNYSGECFILYAEVDEDVTLKQQFMNKIASEYIIGVFAKV